MIKAYLRFQDKNGKWKYSCQLILFDTSVSHNFYFLSDVSCNYTLSLRDVYYGYSHGGIRRVLSHRSELSISQIVVLPPLRNCWLLLQMVDAIRNNVRRCQWGKWARKLHSSRLNLRFSVSTWCQPSASNTTVQEREQAHSFELQIHTFVVFQW